MDFLFTPIIPQILQTKVSVFVQMAQKNLELHEKTRELANLNKDLRVQRVHELTESNMALQLEVIDRWQVEKRASEFATKDALTGLLNRRSLIDRTEDAIIRAARRKESLAVMFLDLDKFKSVNDTFGHDVGDELLRQVASCIKSSVRESDVVARIGGDEFVVLLEGLMGEADAAKLAEKNCIGQCASLQYWPPPHYHVAEHRHQHVRQGRQFGTGVVEGSGSGDV